MISDSDLATRVVISGDTDALGELYQRHASAIHDFLLRTTRDPALAEDLTQMTFLKAFEKRASLRDPSRVRSWLFSIAHHAALDEQRQRHPAEDIHERLDLTTPTPGPEDQVTSKEAAALVWSAAASLEPRQYAVLDLTVRQQLTTPEVAEVLGIDPGHAAVLVNRAKEALGNAVRYLLVARRRTHCATLAAMVPAGVRELTPEQRTSVDHHMRWCATCQVMAVALTRPAEILGGIAVIALPSVLRGGPGNPLPPALHAQLTAARVAQGAQSASAPGLGNPAARSAIRHAATSKLLATVAGVAVVAGAGAVALINWGGSAHPTAAASPISLPSPSRLGEPTPSATTRSPGPSAWTVAKIPYEPTSAMATEDDLNTLSNVSCPSVSLCVVLAREGIVFSTDPTGGASAWTVTKVLGVDLGSESGWLGISCPSAALCVAWDGDVVTSTDPTGGASAWTVTDQEDATFNPSYGGISCPNAGLCVAVDSIMAGVTISTDPTGGAQAWTGVAVDQGNHFRSVSCPSPTLCVAVDDEGNVVTSTNPTGGASAWTVTNVNGSDPLAAVDCPTADLCVAVDPFDDDVLTSTDPNGGASAWTAANVDPKVASFVNGLDAVSCPSVALCVAVNALDDDIAVSADPTGGVSAWSATNVDGNNALYGVSCPSAALCVAVDDVGDVVTGP